MPPVPAVAVKQLLVAPEIVAPFFVQEYASGPVPPAVVQNEWVRPWHTAADVSAVAVALLFAVSVAQRCTGAPQAPVTVTQ
jgi:hypothetical protein